MKRRRLLANLLSAFVLCVTIAHAEQVTAVRLKVQLPQEDARLHIDGVSIDGNGVERNIRATPKPGADHLTATATWKPNGYTEIRRTRSVRLRGNASIVIDLQEASAKEPDKIEVIYVPTPQAAVDAMCKLAKVGPEDVVFDLGCGDGRIVITAVSKFKARRGVGVDINAELVKQCKVNAQQEGVAARVEFRQGDVLEIDDLSSASVVMLYMGEDINLRLKPILQKTLKPGARVVSHSFTMGDWKPQRSESVSTGQVNCDLHLWVIDAATSSLAHGKYEAIQQAVAALEKQGTRVDIQETKLLLTGGQLGVDGLAHVQAFSELRELDLASIPISDKALEKIAPLKKLRRLRIANAAVTDHSLKYLQQLNGLEALSLPLTTIGDDALVHLKALPQLKELNLGVTHVTDAGLEHLQGLTHLEVLNLVGAKISDGGLRRLKDLTNLRTLTLQHVPITDAGLVHLRSLTKLQSLNLRGTRTTVAAVQDLRKRLPAAAILHAPSFVFESP